MSAQEIYLNHAGTSWPKPQVVLDAAHEAMTRSANQWGDYFNQAHYGLAEFFGIPNPEQLLLTPGCTSALTVAIQDVDFGRRNRVLTSVWEHHAMHRPLLKIAKSGILLEYIPASNESSLDLNRLEDELKKRDVGLVAITAAANVTGDLLPYEDVIKLSHQYDTQVLLDAAQVVGWLELDFAALDADFIAFGGHKGMQGLWGIGGLYMAASARMNCSSASCELPQAVKQPRPGYCDAGSVDQIALAALHAAIEWLNNVDRGSGLISAREQIVLIQTTLKSAGARCFAIQAPARRMPCVAFSVEDRSSEEITEALKSQGIIVGSGLQCSPLAHRTLGTEREGLARISVGIGQSASEIDAALVSIKEIISSLVVV